MRVSHFHHIDFFLNENRKTFKIICKQKIGSVFTQNERKSSPDTQRIIAKYICITYIEGAGERFHNICYIFT